MKRKKRSLLTPEEREAHAARAQELQERIRAVEGELAAKGSPLAAMSQAERMAHYRERHLSERKARHSGR